MKNINADTRWSEKQPSGLLSRLAETDERIEQYIFQPRYETSHWLILATGFKTQWGEHWIKSQTANGCRNILLTIEPCDCGRCN